MDSAGKEKGQMDRCTGRHCRPVLQLPTGQSVACKLLALSENKPPALLHDDDPGAHGNEQGASKEAKMDGGKQSERGQER